MVSYHLLIRLTCPQDALQLSLEPLTHTLTEYLLKGTSFSTNNIPGQASKWVLNK